MASITIMDLRQDINSCERLHGLVWNGQENHTCLPASLRRHRDFVTVAVDDFVAGLCKETSKASADVSFSNNGYRLESVCGVEKEYASRSRRSSMCERLRFQVLGDVDPILR